MNKPPIEMMIDGVLEPHDLGDFTPKEGEAYATHSGVLKIGDFEFRCYLLNTGERVIDSNDLACFFSGERQ